MLPHSFGRFQPFNDSTATQCTNWTYGGMNCEGEFLAYFQGTTRSDDDCGPCPAGKASSHTEATKHNYVTGCLRGIRSCVFEWWRHHTPPQHNTTPRQEPETPCVSPLCTTELNVGFEWFVDEGERMPNPTCGECTPGWAGVGGNASCSSCLPGRFASGFQASACVDCGIGRFAQSSGSPNCTAHSVADCDAGARFTPGNATTDAECSECPRGRFQPNSASTATSCISWTCVGVVSGVVGRGGGLSLIHI